MFVTRQELALRPVTLADGALLFRWRNSERIRNVSNSDRELHAEEHAAWLACAVNDPAMRLRIFEHGGVPVGFVSVSSIDRVNERAYWGYYLGEEGLPLGMGAFLELFALDFIFLELGVRRLYLEVLSSNEKVVRLHKRFGFREEGRLRQHVKRGGAFIDVVLMAMFRDEWAEGRRAVEQLCFPPAT